MRRLIADIYKILFKRTGSRNFALLVAILYVSALNMLTIFGLVLMLEGVVEELTYVHIIFLFPYSIITGLAIVVLNFWIMLPLYHLTEEEDIKPAVSPIVIYSLVSLVLLAYILLAN